MDTERALLEAILAAPTDDTPRAVYADFLEQRGDPRGEFITLQLLAARDPFAMEWDRMFELDAAHREAWIPPVVREVAVRNINFRRGFVEQLEVGVDAWVARGGELVRATPLVDLVTKPEWFHDVLVAPHAAGLASIRGTFAKRAADLFTTLANVPPRPALAEIHLYSSQVDDAAIERLVQLPATPRVLGLGSNPVSAAGLRTLVESPFGSQLRRLELGGIALADELPAVLATAPTLRELDLGLTQITAAGVRALSRRLTTLELSGTRFDATTVDALDFPDIEKLALKYGALDDDGVIAFCAMAEHMPNLRWLELEDKRITTRGALAIAECPALAKLQRITVYRARLTFAGREALLARFGRRLSTDYHDKPT